MSKGCFFVVVFVQPMEGNLIVISFPFFLTPLHLFNNVQAINYFACYVVQKKQSTVVKSIHNSLIVVEKNVL